MERAAMTLWVCIGRNDASIISSQARWNGKRIKVGNVGSYYKGILASRKEVVNAPSNKAWRLVPPVCADAIIVSAV